MINQTIENYPDRLYDESRLKGKGKNIYIVESTSELITLVQSFIDSKTPFTVQAGRTSITGASVSDTNDIISIERLNNILDYDKTNHSITVEPGVRLSELHEYIEKICPGYCFGPNPTEPTATMSGLISTNAKGTNYNKYGSVGDNVVSLKILLPDGTIKTINRGENFLKDDTLVLPNGASLKLIEEPYNRYSGALSLHKNEDVLDIFTGTEGILGIILSATLKLEKKIKNKYGVFFFFRNQNVFNFAKYINNLSDIKDTLVCLEYFDRYSLQILQDFKNKSTKLKQIPDLNPLYNSALYIELENENMDVVEYNLFTILTEFNNQGGLENDTWAGVGEDEIAKFSTFRHSLPEAINTLVEENHKNNDKIIKIACDFMQDRNFEELIEKYNTCFTNNNIPHALFGHFRDYHLHLNIMPRDATELALVDDILDNLYSFVNKNLGCLAFENGIGKIKKDLIKKYIDENIYNNGKQLKEYLDKDYLFNRGNIF